VKEKKLNLNYKNGFIMVFLIYIYIYIYILYFRYIYGGRLSLKEHDISDIIKILVAGNELGLQELVAYIQFFLIKTQAYWMEENFNLICQTSFENDSFLELQKFCTHLTSEEPEKIFESPNFSSIPEKLLITVIKSDNIQMEEIQVWEHVLRWGLAQNPELPSDPTNFSKEDFDNLKNSLKNCIPYIKFHNLSSDEFSEKVLPYRKILSEELYEDLLKHFLDSNNQPIKKSRIPKETDIDSKIITFQHVELITKWIDKLEITDEIKNTYKFKLLLRGSRDGFTADKFHEICDNQSNTVTIIKVEDSNEILGGYNPIAWEQGESDDSSYLNSGTAKNSFIFSFKNCYDIKSYILSRVKDVYHAIWNSSLLYSSFGSGDLALIGNIGKCSNGNYEKHIRETADEFIVEEYEVFQIAFRPRVR
jgi:hypothetical protein